MLRAQLGPLLSVSLEMAVQVPEIALVRVHEHERGAIGTLDLDPLPFFDCNDLKGGSVRSK